MAKNNKDRGFVILQRSLLSHWLWQGNEPFCKRAAWIDLILLANHADNKVNINGNVINVARGQHFTSLQKLAKRWGWSVNKVVRYLHRLMCEDMVHTVGYAHGTLITLVNYDKIQGRQKADGYANEQADGYADGHADGQQTINDIQRMNTKNEYNKASPGKEKKWQ